jgi:hypothetical protein
MDPKFRYEMLYSGPDFAPPQGYEAATNQWYGAGGCSFRSRRVGRIRSTSNGFADPRHRWIGDADAGIKLVKADDAFKTIKAGLETYLENQGIVRFEHIFHCAQTSSARVAELPKIFEQRRLRKIL